MPQYRRSDLAKAFWLVSGGNVNNYCLVLTFLTTTLKVVYFKEGLSKEAIIYRAVWRPWPQPATCWLYAAESKEVC